MEFKTSDEILLYFKGKCIQLAIENPPIFSGEEKYRNSEIQGGVIAYGQICQSLMNELLDFPPDGVLIDVLSSNLQMILSSLYSQYEGLYLKQNLLTPDLFR